MYLVTEITILCSFPFIPTQLKRAWTRENRSSSKIISSAFPSAFHDFSYRQRSKGKCVCYTKLRERERNVCSCRWTNSNIIYQAFYRKNTTGFSFKVEAQQESDAFHLCKHIQTHTHTHFISLSFHSRVSWKWLELLGYFLQCSISMRKIIKRRIR